MPAELPLTTPIAECKLDLDGLRRQRERYRRLGGSAESIERADDKLLVWFGTDLDEALLRETLAVEAECCPFFNFDYSPEQQRLRIGVDRREQLPALDALAYALGETSPA
jgi:hypothetical protein